MCSEKALKNSEIWVYMNSQMTLQRLNAKSNVNARLFDDIRQNLTNLCQNQCQIRIQWISSRKNIIGNEKADQLAKSAAQELSVIGNTKAIIIRFVKSDSNLIDKSKSKLTRREQVINRLQNSTEDCVLTQKSKSNSFAPEGRTGNNIVSEKYSVSYQITICFIFSWCARQ